MPTIKAVFTTNLAVLSTSCIQHPSLPHLAVVQSVFSME